MIIENLVTKVFQLLLLLSPICVGADINMDLFDLIFFRTGIIVLFMVSLLDTPKRSMPQYINKIVFGLLGLCLFNIFVHTFAPAVMALTMNLFLGIAGIYIVHTYLDEKADIGKYILIAGAINLLFFTSQKLGFDPVFDKVPQAGAFIGNGARLGTYLALIIPFASLWTIPVVILYALVIGQYVLFFPVILILLVRVKSLKIKVLTLVLFIIGILVLKNHILTSIKVRFDLGIIPGLKYFFDRPLIGFGLGNDIILKSGDFSTSYIQFILGVGILGLVWIGYTFKNIYKKIGDGRGSIALITLLGVMAIEYPLEITRFWYLIMAIIIMFLLKKEN